MNKTEKQWRKCLQYSLQIIGYYTKYQKCLQINTKIFNSPSFTNKKEQEQTTHRLSNKHEKTCKKQFTELANKQIVRC